MPSDTLKGASPGVTQAYSINLDKAVAITLVDRDAVEAGPVMV